MSVSQVTLNRAVTTARTLESQGYFEKVRQGDQTAASLFARLTAYTLNPNGDSFDYGCLSKSPGETQVDGFAEDAICYGNDPADRMNVVDLINGAGAPGASIGGAVKERREHNKWVKPVPLSEEQMTFLRSGGTPVPPQPQPPAQKPYPGDLYFIEKVGMPLEADYTLAGQRLNAGSATWFARTIYDAVVGAMTMDASVAKHRAEWRAALGLPPL